MSLDLTLDSLFRRNAARHPDAPALADPPDRDSITGEPPRLLTYAQADRAVETLAQILQQSGLSPGSVVAMQLPNVVESVIAPLAALRAGLVPALVPLLFRRHDAVAALAQAHAKALVTCARVGDCDHGQLALEIAAELFPIRVVFGFGPDLPDGVVALDDWPAPDALDATPPASEIVTFEATPEGPAAVTHDTASLLAAGLSVHERGGMAGRAAILSTLHLASFAGLSAVLLPWLFTGGALVLHHPFDADILSEQIARHRPKVLAVPEAVLPALARSHLLDAGSVTTLVSVSRAPQRVPAASLWPEGRIRLVEVDARAEPGFTAVGGCRFDMQAVQDIVRQADRGAVIAALPHALCGHRLAGHCAEPEAMQAALQAMGQNPLIVEAFSARAATPR